ncbi:MAG: SDR family NAD(P)-dependent oxidoreductase, partial [Hyphomicrobiales bacterium]|nr:SDR family NAD(P)-dependent oxidoreductase [Hyphomicrobiales bacterium]
IHNAGIVLWRDPADVETEDYSLSSRVNNDAAFFLVSTVLPGMRAQGFGRIVLTTSGWALAPATGSQELALYAHGKGAQLGLGMALSQGAGHPNIRTNLIAPVAATRIFRGPVTASLRPESAAGAVAWLASSRCTVTGCLVRAYGGTPPSARCERRGPCGCRRCNRIHG